MPLGRGARRRRGSTPFAAVLQIRKSTGAKVDIDSIRSIVSPFEWTRKRAYIAGGVAAFAIAVVVVAWSGDDGVPTDANFICVRTGVRFNLVIADVAIIPAANPETGQRTLLPCAWDDERRLCVDEHYRAVLDGRLAGVNHWVDPVTLRVRSLRDGD